VSVFSDNGHILPSILVVIVKVEWTRAIAALTNAIRSGPVALFLFACHCTTRGMGYIAKDALENLRKYAYKGVDKCVAFVTVRSESVLDLVRHPMASIRRTQHCKGTQITLSGLSLVFINFATVLYFDPLYLTEKDGVYLPRWVYFSCAIGLFLYQTFDAIDGKQARRTGMAGPLGEMFDHGCDAMNTTLEAILTCQALNLGRSWWTVASQMATLANFYLTTWEEYHTGQLYLGVFSGPVEGILMIVVIFLISGTFGPAVWDQGLLTVLRLQDLPQLKGVPNLPLNEAFMVFGAVGLIFNILTSYGNVHQAMKEKKQSTFRALLRLFPFVISAGIQVFWLSHPRSDRSAIINSPLFVPFLCAWGLQFAHQVGKMILAHVTKTDFPAWDWIWVWSFAAAVDANLPRLIGRPPLLQTSPKNTAYAVWLTLAISFIAYARFCTLVIYDITNFMGIACFTVRKKDEDGVWQDTVPGHTSPAKKKA
ncbi:unnamed protein product, partial [Mycena citricolor]